MRDFLTADGGVFVLTVSGGERARETEENILYFIQDVVYFLLLFVVLVVLCVFLWRFSPLREGGGRGSWAVSSL